MRPNPRLNSIGRRSSAPVSLYWEDVDSWDIWHLWAIGGLPFAALLAFPPDPPTLDKGLNCDPLLFAVQSR
jgi:hypothetical protein